MFKSLALMAFAVAMPVCFADSAAGLAWTPPSGWISQSSRPMRAATYTVPAAAGDKEDGECAVYYFGPGQGGSVEANLDRWTKQFEQPDAKPQVKKRTVHGIAVTTLDVSGTYSGMGGPMATSKSAKPGYRCWEPSRRVSKELCSSNLQVRRKPLRRSEPPLKA